MRKKNDDLKELEKQLSEDDVLIINKKVTTEIENAINFAESSNFPESQNFMIMFWHNFMDKILDKKVINYGEAIYEAITQGNG